MSKFIGSEYVTRMEMIQPPQPAESPDDWVTQDHVPVRSDVDEWRWVYVNDGNPIADERGAWKSRRQIIRKMWHGLVDGTRFRLEVRCRRKDLPSLPAAVHTGGPYVSHSVHRDLWEQYDKSMRQYKDAIASLEKASSGQVIGGLKQTISSQQAEIVQLNTECAGQVLEMASVMRQRDEALRHMADHLCRNDVNNPNGWPLVPVDPLCIPDGHRAVEVTLDLKGKLVASDNKKALKVDWKSLHPRLVVEPIPAEQPAQSPIPRPELPAWIRPGWWVAMDDDAAWWLHKTDPLFSDGEYCSENGMVCLEDCQITPSMRAVPKERCRDAKWQVE